MSVKRIKYKLKKSFNSSEKNFNFHIIYKPQSWKKTLTFELKVKICGILWNKKKMNKISPSLFGQKIFNTLQLKINAPFWLHVIDCSLVKLTPQLWSSANTVISQTLYFKILLAINYLARVSNKTCRFDSLTEINFNKTFAF